MPVWKADPVHLALAVVSVLAQTRADWELVIVEDPSDRPVGVLMEAFNDPRIRYIANTSRTSFAEQLNLGLSLARADLIARMDADDICEPTRLQAQLDYLREQPRVGLVGSDLTVIDTAGRTIGRRRYPESHAAIGRALPRYNPLAHPAVMFRKQVVLDAGGYQGDMCIADYDLWNRLYARGVQMANLPEPLLRYRIHPAGMKTARLREMIRATLAMKQQYWQGRLDLAGQVRMAAERLLLWLPASLVLRLFLATQLRPIAAGDPL
jgi:glycosyltransferase involved in cell wall biosynthesis